MILHLGLGSVGWFFGSVGGCWGWSSQWCLHSVVPASSEMDGMVGGWLVHSVSFSLSFHVASSVCCWTSSHSGLGTHVKAFQEAKPKDDDTQRVCDYRETWLMGGHQNNSL